MPILTLKTSSKTEKSEKNMWQTISHLGILIVQISKDLTNFTFYNISEQTVNKKASCHLGEDVLCASSFFKNIYFVSQNYQYRVIGPALKVWKLSVFLKLKSGLLHKKYSGGQPRLSHTNNFFCLFKLLPEQFAHECKCQGTPQRSSGIWVSASEWTSSFHHSTLHTSTVGWVAN